MKILRCRLHSSHITPSVLLTKAGTMLWTDCTTVIIPGDKQHTNCEPNMAKCLEDDMGNEKHLLLDSINSVRVWGCRAQYSAHPSEVLEKHSLHVTLRDAEFPAIPRCSRADVLRGVFQRKSYLPAKEALMSAVAHTSVQKLAFANHSS